jgi:hypothetical protein
MRKDSFNKLFNKSMYRAPLLTFLNLITFIFLALSPLNSSAEKKLHKKYWNGQEVKYAGVLLR